MSRNTRAPIKLRVYPTVREMEQLGPALEPWIRSWTRKIDSAVGAATFAGYNGA